MTPYLLKCPKVLREQRLPPVRGPREEALADQRQRLFGRKRG